ncbi:MAG: antitoxin VbhA family protein [Lautropia sp.]|nr:antitoxin VbhA family protein [Lautropia sp.]
MNKAVTMTFRVEADLRAQFAEAAELEHRPAAQVLRDFMREYVQRSAARKTPQTISVPIGHHNRREREEAINYARASVALEGFQLSPTDEEHAQRFIRGEIDLAQFVKGAE